MMQILENIIILIEWGQVSTGLVNAVFEFFNVIEPTLSSFAIISGLVYFLYEKLVKLDSLHASTNVTFLLISDNQEGLKKNHNS